MLLTNCAACAAPLAHDAPRCIRCHTRYCNKTCQHDHWRRGHKQMCKKIHRGGNAEQYHADKKYKEAVAVAVEACAADTKGQKCYICLEAVHPHTGEGLVRGCACGDRDGVKSPELGVAHVSCLADQAKILFAEVEENNVDYETFNERWDRWHTCSLCEQHYHGVVLCALGWACWKTYVGRPEENSTRRSAMKKLGVALFEGSRYEESLAIFKSLLQHGHDDIDMLFTQGNIACCYAETGRVKEALKIFRKVYALKVKVDGNDDPHTHREAGNVAECLLKLDKLGEAEDFLNDVMPIAQRSLGDDHKWTLLLRSWYGKLLCRKADASGVEVLEDIVRRSNRVLGSNHPDSKQMQEALDDARTKLAALDSS